MTKTKDNYFSSVLAENDLWLAPLAGVTDCAFRTLCVKMGAALTTTEMVSSKGLYYKNENTSALLELSEYEKNTGVQLFGSEPEIFSEVIKRYINSSDFAFVDINMGCPVKKVVSNHEGSFLMTDEALACKIVEAAKKASQKPVSVKTRLGFTKDEQNITSFAKALENAGADLIAIHARTRDMMFSGEAEYEKVALVKQNSGVPIVANGDIINSASYEAVKKFTACDGFMIGRAAMGNPFIFREIIAHKNGTEYTPAFSEKLSCAKEQFKLMLSYKSEHVSVNEFKKQLAWYIKGSPKARYARGRINELSSAAEVYSLIDELN